MPLSPPSAERMLMHRRSIELCGYKRADGLWDIEARLTDVKNHDYLLSSKLVKKGDAVHDMWIRATIDAQMTILAAEASSDETPYEGFCGGIAPHYGQLVGLNLFHGFRSAVKALFDGVRGCSHVTELVMSLPTAALQTFASDMRDNEPDGAASGKKPFQLDRCHALDSHSEAVQRYYPRWYRGSKTG